MKVTFPHMGTLQLAVRDLFRRLGTSFVVPPPTSSRTLQLATRLAPEGACLPLKITLGNFIEALDRGADTILMIGGSGPCRLGYYAEVHRRALLDAGYHFDMVVAEPPSAGWLRFLATLRRVAPGKSLWQVWRALSCSMEKARAMDWVERHVLECRAWEMERGATTAAWEQGLALIEAAETVERIRSAQREALALISAVPRDEGRDVLRMGMIGEFYLLLEPFLKFGIEEHLAQLGVAIDRAVYATDWISRGGRNPVAGVSNRELDLLARPYLSHTVGGDGLRNVGHAVHYVNLGYDGLIHLFPFTCMPDTIAKAVLARLHRERDIPMLTLIIDELTGRAGLLTRLEAFVDLMRSRRHYTPASARPASIRRCTRSTLPASL